MIILNPFAPHITEEIYEQLGYSCNGSISSQNWPEYDENLIASDKVIIVVQINGKTRGTLNVEPDIKQKDLSNIVLNTNAFKKYLDNYKVKKEIYVPNRLINLVVS